MCNRNLERVRPSEQLDVCSLVMQIVRHMIHESLGHESRNGGGCSGSGNRGGSFRFTIQAASYIRLSLSSRIPLAQAFMVNRGLRTTSCVQSVSKLAFATHTVCLSLQNVGTLAQVVKEMLKKASTGVKEFLRKLIK